MVLAFFACLQGSLGDGKVLGDGWEPVVGVDVERVAGDGQFRAHLDFVQSSLGGER